jgi:hypothetical protein
MRGERVDDFGALNSMSADPESAPAEAVSEVALAPTPAASAAAVEGPPPEAAEGAPDASAAAAPSAEDLATAAVEITTEAAAGPTAEALATSGPSQVA